MKRKTLLVTVLLLVFLMPMIPSALAQNDTETTNTNSAWDTIVSMIRWFIKTSMDFMGATSENAHQWFGIPPTVAVFGIMLIFFIIIRYKLNTFLFWGLLLLMLFVLMQSGIINQVLGGM